MIRQGFGRWGYQNPDGSWKATLPDGDELDAPCCSTWSSGPQAVTDAAYAIDAVVTGHRQAMDAIGGKFAERQAASTTAGSGRRPS